MQEKSPNATEEIGGIEVELQPDKDTPNNRVYANFARVSQTPYDFSISFCDATPISIDQKTEVKLTHKIPIVAEIAVSFHLVPGLIKALQTQWEIYQKNAGGWPNEKE